MAVRTITKTPKKGIEVQWFTPSHRLFVIGKGGDKFYASRGPEPTFLVEGDTQAEVEQEAGRLINAFTIKAARSCPKT